MSRGCDTTVFDDASRAVDALRAADAALDALLDLDTARLNDDALLEHVAALESLSSRIAAAQVAALADFARRPARVVRPDDDDVAAVSATWAPIGRVVREFCGDEVAVQLRISRQDADARISTGAALMGLPFTRTSLSAGRIDLRRARLITDETASLSPDAACEVDAAIIERAERLPTARLRPVLRRAVVAAEPVVAEQREERARAERRVVITPLPDGMAELWALLPAAEAMTVKTAITAAALADKARGDATDDRTMDQRRADALVAPFTHALTTGELPGGERLAKLRGRPAELQVTVSAETLLGVNDAPAELTGYGPISAAAARELAPDARWRRVLTDPVSGTVLDVSTTTYRPSARVERLVQTKVRMCAFPGCGTTAVACDLDHVVPFPNGPTGSDNLVPLCRRHHRFKQSRAVSVVREPTGLLGWTLPTGHRATGSQEPLGPTREIRRCEPTQCDCAKRAPMHDADRGDESG